MRSTDWTSWNHSGWCLWSCVCWANLALSLFCKYLIICCYALVSCTSLSILSIGIGSTCSTSAALEYLSATTFYCYACSLSVVDSCSYWTRYAITRLVYSSIIAACWLLATLSSDWRSGVGLALFAPSLYGQERKLITSISNACVSLVVWVSISLTWSALISSEDFISKTLNRIASKSIIWNFFSSLTVFTSTVGSQISVARACWSFTVLAIWCCDLVEWAFLAPSWLPQAITPLAVISDALTPVIVWISVRSTSSTFFELYYLIRTFTINILATKAIVWHFGVANACLA